MIPFVDRLSAARSIDMLLCTIFEDPYEGLQDEEALYAKPHKIPCHNGNATAALPPPTLLLLLPWAFARLGILLAASIVLATTTVSHIAATMLHVHRRAASPHPRAASTALHCAITLFGCTAAAAYTLCAVDALVGVSRLYAPWHLCKTHLPQAMACSLASFKIWSLAPHLHSQPPPLQ